MSLDVVLDTAGRRAGQAPLPVAPIDVALLGYGRIGSAVAELAHSAAGGPAGARIRVTTALVRATSSARHAPGIVLTSDPHAVVASSPDVIVEVLGGIEPARTLVREALERGTAVVTANKSLLAAHGDELLEVAGRTGTPLLYEASVLAGVPFLGSFARRPYAARVSRISGILNGTSNFILSRMRSHGVDLGVALADAQQLGFAEPDPRNDLLGIDAAEKLSVLLRHFRCGSVHPRDIETTGLAGLRSSDFEHAAQFGGALKPIVSAECTADGVSAFVGAAFVPSAHPLSRVDGVENAVALRTASGDLFFSGPGAGPLATAATVLDDVVDAATGAWRPSHDGVRRVAAAAPATAWFCRISGTSLLGLPAGEDVADLLGAHGVWLRRTSEPETRAHAATRAVLTYPCPRPRLERALAALCAAAGCESFAIRVLEH